MHSRTFCIVEKNTPQHKDDLDIIDDLTDDEMLDYLSFAEADYVNESDVECDFSWLIEEYPFIKKIDTTTFKVDQQEFHEFFIKKLKEFKDISATIIDEQSYTKNIYRLTHTIEDTQGFNIFLDNWCTTIMDFLLSTDTIDKEYEIVRTFDYHY